MYSKKKYEDSIAIFKEALKLEKKSNDEILKKKINGKLQDTYTQLAALASKEGDNAVKIRDYKLAHKNYLISVKWAKLAEKPKLIKKYEKKLNRTPNIQPFS
jgi:tetratricopeptide (TPR) repeat protein